MTRGQKAEAMGLVMGRVHGVDPEFPPMLFWPSDREGEVTFALVSYALTCRVTEELTRDMLTDGVADAADPQWMSFVPGMAKPLVDGLTWFDAFDRLWEWYDDSA